MPQQEELPMIFKATEDNRGSSRIVCHNTSIRTENDVRHM